MGSHPIALPMLELLSKKMPEISLVGIISQPDRRSGRGQHLLPNPISAWALENAIPLGRPDKPSDETVAWIQNRQCDIILVMAYGYILRKNIREAVPSGIYNLHASLLPRFRGAAPIEAALASGITETGISLMEVAQGMDAGDVFATQPVAISPEDNAESLTQKLSLAARDIVRDQFLSLCRGTLSRQAQDPSKITYCRKLEKEDRFLDFTQPAKVLLNRIRALSPHLGCIIEVGNECYKIESTRTVSQTAYSSGMIFLDKENLCVACGSREALVIDLIQKPGGKKMPTKRFLQGNRGFLNAGCVKNHSPMKPFESSVFPF
ncbi:MAG: methionyl-tRNA formyltransferase [Verrucomicrobiota bacterium]|nr:MAG: methionyl-tRNA formyltransferase [Verrucomicrobiota bacterium]